jgi:two-component system chemotaxis response regulator CheY
MTGVELLRQLRTARPNMPFLMITARGNAEAVNEARDHGVSAYLVKPFAPAELERKLLSLYRRSRNGPAAPAETAESAEES